LPRFALQYSAARKGIEDANARAILQADGDGTLRTPIPHLAGRRGAGDGVVAGTARAFLIRSAPAFVMTAATTVWTIGHSTRTADEFVHVLKAHGIEVVADVRRFPGSRRHPHFGGPALQERLAREGIDYAWLSQLGGRRRGDAGAEHLGWRNPSFRAYAAYTWTEDFARGLEELLHIASGRRTTLMCSEQLWWRCHRALISDVLRFVGMEVLHIAGDGQAKVHPYTSPARIIEGELVYPGAAPEPCTRGR
jgi:hypothetical protein